MNFLRWFFLVVIALLSLAGCDESKPSPQAAIPHLDSLLIQGIQDTRALKFEKAQKGLSQLLLEAENRNSSKYRVLATLNLGNLYHHFNLDDEALKFYLECLELAENSEQEDLLNSIYNNIGIIYARNNAFVDAERYFRSALEISRKQDLQSKEGMNLINLGIAVLELGNEEEAIKLLNEATEIYSLLNDSTNLGAIENTLGTIYFDKGEYVPALHYYRKAHRLSPENQQHWFKAESSLNLAKTYFEFDQIDSARKYLDDATVIFQELDDTKFLVEVNMVRSKTERKAGNNALALNHFEEALRLKDELIEEKTSKWVSERQMNYEYGKKEKEVELLRLDSQRRQTIWIGSAIAGALIIVLLILILRSKIQNLRQNNIILHQEKEVIQLTVEKDAAYREKMEQDLKNKEEVNAVERAKLRQEIDFRTRELVTKALHLVNKNETLNEVDELLAKYADLSEKDREKAIGEIRNRLRFEKNLDEDWESFKLHFEEVSPNFFSVLSSDIPELNSGDLRMCAYLRLDLNTNEIAKIFNISPDSVRKRKQRLKEKLNLSPQLDLIDWLKSSRFDIN